jgi:WD40 repeat protein
MDLARRRAPRLLRGHEGYVDLAFAHRGRMLASGGEDMVIRLWDPDAPARDTSIETRSIKIQDIEFLADSRHFVVAAEESTVVGTNEQRYSTVAAWELGQVAPLAVATNLGRPLHQSIGLPGDGQFVACNEVMGEGRLANTLRLFSLPRLEPLTNWPGSDLVPSIDGSTMVYIHGNRLFQRRSLGDPPQLVGESTNIMVKLAISPDGRFAVTDAKENSGALTFWSLSRRWPPVTIEKHSIGIHMLAFSPDSHWLASASWDRTVGLWDAPARRWAGPLKGHRAAVTCVAFSPDSRTLASGSKDGTVRLWHVRTRGELAVFTAQLGEVWAVAFSPDGQWLLAGGTNGRIQQWRAPSWEELAGVAKSKSTREALP